MRRWKSLTGSPGGPMEPGYPLVPGGPWGKIIQSIKQEGWLFFLQDVIPGNLIGRNVPARPSFLWGRVTLAHPADPADDGSEGWLENEGEDVIGMSGREKWAKDKASQYQREETANWLVPSLPQGRPHLILSSPLHLYETSGCRFRSVVAISRGWTLPARSIGLVDSIIYEKWYRFPDVASLLNRGIVLQIHMHIWPELQTSGPSYVSLPDHRKDEEK